ncbi:MAG: M50 family metallopeptidase, partial [Myxococcota bacterium]
MFKSYRIGTIWGFPIEINLSLLFLIAAAVLFMDGLSALLIIPILFVSVLLHELGHAVVARHLGVSIAGIELGFLGGAAKMTSQPKTANHEALIAAAGPLVSFALAGIGLSVGALTDSSFIYMIGLVNGILGAFNLIPALPMDGVRILRALLTRRYDFVRATEISVTVARGVAIAFGIVGLILPQIFLIILAPFLWLMSSA